MDKTRPSKRAFRLLSADFIKRIKQYHWEQQEEKVLISRLHESVQKDDFMAETYSLLKEMIKRKTGLSLFDTQLLAAYSMQQGRIAELPTGEGKTLAAVVTAAVFALKKQPVHILVFNDYLAYRDYSDNRSIYETCGLTCGYIVGSSDDIHRKTAYSCDVVYVSAKEAAFDYLRGFLCTERDRLFVHNFSVALVDEADSILIDEARIPLVLAGNNGFEPATVEKISKEVSTLMESDYGMNESANQIWLTETGIEKMESSLQIKNLYLTENIDTLAMINAALKAKFLLKRDKDYIVKDRTILVIDELTGRVAESRRFPDLLHQAVEVQELGVENASTIIYNSISMQAFLKLYGKLCGMTGTAYSSSSEFWGMYGLEVDVIPPHTACIRIDHPDLIFLDKNEQEAAILSRIQSSHEKGQPILIGTQSVEESEHFSSLLSKRNLCHFVLNAKNDTEEAQIIADAGKPYQITISTNMAGRGVDIRLGGKDEKQSKFARDVGGLFVISTGINRSLRIDNQLRGRAGRQGDPGESQFFICLDGLKLETFFELGRYRPNRYPKLLRRAQKIQEGRDAETRYILDRYSQIIEIHRQKVTRYRTQLLLDFKSPEIMRLDKPMVYEKLLKQYGARGVKKAEKQLTLYFININWAFYLSAMEDKRDSIHLMVIGGKNPLEEYTMFAISSFHEMMEDIRRDVIEHMQKCTITEDGIDMEKAGLLGATTTWTYMIDESSSQFSRIPYLVKTASNTIRGTVFTVQELIQILRRNMSFLTKNKKA